MGVGDIIADGLNRDEITELAPGTFNTQFFLNYWRLKIKEIEVKVESRTLGTAAVWGTSIWGTATWGAGTQGSWTAVETLAVEQKIANAFREQIARWFTAENAHKPMMLLLGTDSTAFSIDDERLGTLKGFSPRITRDVTTSKQAEFQFIVNTADTELAGEAIREVGMIGGNYERVTINTAVGGQRVDLSAG